MLLLAATLKPVLLVQMITSLLEDLCAPSCSGPEAVKSSGSNLPCRVCVMLVSATDSPLHLFKGTVCRTLCHLAVRLQITTN